MKMKHLPKEWDLISGIQNIVRRDKADTLIPIGDDAFAALAPRQPIVMAQDMMIEDVHFDLQFSSAADLGYKALAVNLSDLAAMGATPRWAQVSLGITQKQNKPDNSWLDEFYRGMTELADRFDVEIVGGDLCQSPKALVIDVSVFGEAAHPISRKGARIDDYLLCSGPLGLAAQGLESLRSCKVATMSIQKHLRPQPRLDLLSQLQTHANKIHALIDISDGLISESLHLTRKLEIGLDLWVGSIPIHPEVEDLKKALWGGEDYELLMAIPEESLALFKDWIVLGKFVESPEITLCLDDGKRQVIDEFIGWRHF